MSPRSRWGLATLCCLLFASPLVYADTQPATWVLVIHGGAGALPENLPAAELAQIRAAMNDALQDGGRILSSGGSSLDAVQATLHSLENSGLFDAGRGAVLNHDGQVELDAALMNGADQRAGAVAAVRNIANPIDLARRVMDRSPHVLLVGPGAERFAAEQGIVSVPDAYFDHPFRHGQLQKALDAERHAKDPNHTDSGPKGTVGAVALDMHGNLAAGTSTGGLNAKHPGRVGDSPLIGAGTYAANGICAVSTTGLGEYFIRATAASDLCARVRYQHETLDEAGRAVLRGISVMGGEGGLIALGADGTVSTPHSTPALLRGELRAGSPAQIVVANDGATVDASAAATLKSVADEVLAWRLEHEPYLRLVRGLPIQHLQELDEQSERASSDFAARELTKLQAVALTDLTQQERSFDRELVAALTDRAGRAPFYWLDFLITPYRGGDEHELVTQVLGSQKIVGPADSERYLTLLRDYARVLDEMRAKTVGQRKRGILLSKAAIPNARKTIESLHDTAYQNLVPVAERLTLLSSADAGRFVEQAHRTVEQEILPRLVRLRALLDDSYVRAAPTTVGLGQYPNGKAYYRHLIRAVLGEDRDPADIHALGLEHLARIDTRLSQIRTELKFQGDRPQFEHFLKTDPRFIATSPAEVERRFRGYLDRVEPWLPRWFEHLPRAPYAVKRADPASESGMSYGHYQAPTAADPSGYYFYNGSGLETRTLVGAEHLIFHELMPGHHLQIALEQQASGRHPLRQFLTSDAYVEGWAEYAASLGEDAGLYSSYDLYGHLMMQSFLAARLVLDTGMNEYGWSLGKARDFMAAHSLEGIDQIDTETLRYSTDIPAQALGYYLGYDKMRTLRAKAEQSLGDRFDLKAFHSTVLEYGAVPLGVLEDNVNQMITQRRAVGQQTLPASSGAHFAAYNRATVLINAPASRVWSMLLNRARWAEGFAAERHLSGPNGATGEQILYTWHTADGQIGDRLEETLLAVPAKHLLLRLAPADGSTTNTFADFWLVPHGKTTEVTLELRWMDHAEAAATPDDVAKVRTSYSAQTQSAIERQLKRLQHASESGT